MDGIMSPLSFDENGSPYMLNMILLTSQELDSFRSPRKQFSFLCSF